MEKRSIRIRTLRHKTTGLYMALSDDLEGLVVHGNTIEEVKSRIPELVKDLLEAAGVAVSDVEVLEDNRLSIAQFGPPAFIANASLRTAACDF